MIDLTWISYVIATVVLYYLGLFVLSLRPPAAPADVPMTDLYFVLVTPARNEELCIEGTLRSQLALGRTDCLLVVVNDGSSDETSTIAHEVAEESGRLIVLDREPAISGRGKSDVLNHAYRAICALWEDGESRLGGLSPDKIIIGVIDADGHLSPDALSSVAARFSDGSVGSVQVAVQIRNAGDSLLARLQDMEFVAFSALVQVARDRLGSSGLGGNGQFSRLSALQTLGPEPWDRRSLTEDLDLGLRLVELGWETRFCGQTHVTQQGLTRIRPLFRQRTRWIQGHYQCWKHLPRLARSPSARWYTRADLIGYLLLVVTVTLVFADMIIGVLGTTGAVEVQNRFLDFLTTNEQRYAQVALAVAPITAFLYTYQQRSRQPLSWWELPAFGAAFTIYSYFWVLATVRAWARMATGRWSWVKTPRAPA